MAKAAYRRSLSRSSSNSWFQQVQSLPEGKHSSRQQVWPLRWEAEGLCLLQAQSRESRLAVGAAFTLLYPQWHPSCSKTILANSPKQYHQLGSKYSNACDCGDIYYSDHISILQHSEACCSFVFCEVSGVLHGLCPEVIAAVFALVEFLFGVILPESWRRIQLWL